MIFDLATTTADICRLCGRGFSPVPRAWWIQNHRYHETCARQHIDDERRLAVEINTRRDQHGRR